MRSGSPPLSGRRSCRGWKHRSKEVVILIAKGVNFLAIICYRSTHAHPFLASLVLFAFLLYAFLPTFFWFLVSSSPVIICTALLLGTLLSFGQLHIPANEEEEEKKKMVHRISALRASATAGRPILRRREEYSDGEIKDEGVVPSLEVGEPSAKIDAQDKISSESSLANGQQMESRESGVGVLGVLGRIADRLLGTWHLSGSSYNQIQQNRVISRSSWSSTMEGADEGTSIQHRHVGGIASRSTPEEVSVRVPRGLAKSEGGDSAEKVVESKSFESDMHYYPLLHPSLEQDGHSDFVSDNSEGCSPDASISDINPILDELCPFIPTNQADGLNRGTSTHHVHADTDDSDSTSELSTQPHESDYDSDEMMESMEEYNKMGGGLSWTMEDEKNVMDLGSSEIERNRRLESLMAKHRVGKNQSAEVGNPPDPRNEDISPVMGDLSHHMPIQISSITTKRKNPFHEDSVDIRGLPPIPGSAPSILLRKSNPFDFPEKNLAENDVGPSEPHFQGFTVGTSGVDGEEKQNFGMEPYPVPEQRSYAKYHRQLSELSYPRGQSIFKSEPLYPVPDHGFHRGLPEQKLDEENFISFAKQGGTSLSKIEEGGVLKGGSFVPPATTLVPVTTDAWTGPIDERGAHVHFDASRISHARNTPLHQSTDTVQYESFTTLETKLDDSGTTVERTFHFGSHPKLDCPKHQSDDTTDSDSSSESESYSGSEHSGHGMLPASHPSMDKPVVLPSEVSILPEIANKLKAASGLEEEQSSDVSSDSDVAMNRYGGVAVLGYTKEVDEHILSELDVVGDFRGGTLQAAQEQVLKESRLDINPEHQDNKSPNLESTACQVDHEVKYPAVSSGKEDVLVELHTSPKAVDSNLQEIEARCLDDIDLALMHVEGSLHDNLVEVEANSSSKAADSDLQEIDARCLDDIDLELMRAEGSLRGSHVEVENDSVPKAADSDLHEIDARCLDDIDLELMRTEGSLCGTSVEAEMHSSPKAAAASDMHEIDAQCLDDIDLELMRTEGSLHGNCFEARGHSLPKAVAASDLHEIEARCLDDIDLELMRTEGSLDGNHFEVQEHSGSKADDASDLQEIDARCLDDIDLELMRTEGSLCGTSVEVETISSTKANASEMHEIDAQCLDDIDLELMRVAEGSFHGSSHFEVQEHSGLKADASDLQEINARCLDDIDLELMRAEGSLCGNLVEIEEQSGPKAGDSDLHEIKARCLDDIDLELMQAEGSLRGNRSEVEARSSSKAVVISDLHEIDARCLDDIDSELMRAEGLLTGNFAEVEAHPDPEAVFHSDLHEIEARSLNDIDLAIMHAEGSLPGDLVEDTHPKQMDHPSDLHEIEAQSLDELNEAMKKQETTQEPDLVSPKEQEEQTPHEVEAFGKQNIPQDLVATSSEEDDEIEDHSVKIMHVESEKETAHLGPHTELLETQELESSIGREGSYSEIEAERLGELEKEDVRADHLQEKASDNHPEEEAKKAPETSHSEPASELNSVEGTSSSSSTQFLISGLEVGFEMQDTVIKSDPREIEVQSSKNLDEMAGQPHESQEIVAQSEGTDSAMELVGQVKQLDSNLGTEANNKKPKPEIHE